MAQGASIKIPPKTNILPSVLKQSDDITTIYESFKTEGSLTEQKLLEYIKDCIDTFYKKRIGDYETSDARKLDSELIYQFSIIVRDMMIKFMNDLDKMIDISTIVKGYYNGNDANKKVVSEISHIIKKALTDIAKRKINATLLNKIKIKDIIAQINGLNTLISEKEAKALVNDIFSNSSAFKKAQSQFNSNIDSYRDSIVKLFEKEIFDPIELNKSIIKKQKAQEEELNNRYNQRISKMLGVNTSLFQTKEMYMNKNARKHASDLVDLIILNIAKSSVQRQYELIKKVVKTITRIPQLIIKAAVKAAVKVVKEGINLVLKSFSNIILKPIFFILRTSANLIMNLAQGIYKSITFILKSNLRYALLTPSGMYALGFMVGLIWTKLRKLMPENAFSIDGMLNFIKMIVMQFKNITDIFEEFMIRHPGIPKFFRDTKEFFVTLFNEGWDKAKTTTEIGRWINRWLIDNKVIKSLITVGKWIVKLGMFFVKHPITTSLIFGTAKAIGFINKVSGFLRLFGFNLKGGVFGGLMSAMIFGVTKSVVSGLFKPFTEYNDERIEISKDEFLKQRTTADSDFVKTKYGNLSMAQKSRYAFLMDQIDEEYSTLDRYNEKLDFVKHVLKNGYYSRFIDEIPTLEYLILNSSPFGIDIGKLNDYKTAKANYVKTQTPENADELLGALEGILGNRVDRITNILKRMTYDTVDNNINYLNSIISFDANKGFSLIPVRYEEYEFDKTIIRDYRTGKSEVIYSVPKDINKFDSMQSGDYSTRFNYFLQNDGYSTAYEREQEINNLLSQSTVEQRNELYTLLEQIDPKKNIEQGQMKTLKELTQRIHDEHKKRQQKIIDEDIRFLNNQTEVIRKTTDEISHENESDLNLLEGINAIEGYKMKELRDKNKLTDNG